MSPASRIAAAIVALLVLAVLLALTIFVPYAGLVLGAVLIASGLLGRRRPGRLARAALVAGAVLFVIGVGLALSYSTGGGTEIQPPTRVSR